jgi:hypothetical protein
MNENKLPVSVMEMKTAIYIEQGVTQLVLTPENQWERNALSSLKEGSVSFHRGSFYACQGGYNRQSDEDDSLMLRISAPPLE